MTVTSPYTHTENDSSVGAVGRALEEQLSIQWGHSTGFGWTQTESH